MKIEAILECLSDNIDNVLGRGHRRSILWRQVEAMAILHRDLAAHVQRIEAKVDEQGASLTGLEAEHIAVPPTDDAAWDEDDEEYPDCPDCKNSGHPYIEVEEPGMSGFDYRCFCHCEIGHEKRDKARREAAQGFGATWKTISNVIGALMYPQARWPKSLDEMLGDLDSAHEHLGAYVDDVMRLFPEFGDERESLSL